MRAVLSQEAELLRHLANKITHTGSKVGGNKMYRCVGLLYCRHAVSDEARFAFEIGRDLLCTTKLHFWA